MKIERVLLQENVTSTVGLKAVRMERLGQVVLIAGKNGSGKSRLLELIRGQVNAAPTYDHMEEVKRKITAYEGHILFQEVNIKRAQEALEITLSGPERHGLQNTIAENERNIINYKAEIGAWQRVIDIGESFTFFPKKEDNALVDFVPRSLELQDSHTISTQQLDDFSKHIYSMGTGNISTGAIPAIEKIQRSWVNANTTTTDDLNITLEEKTKINTDYEKLKNYIKLFLNTDLKRSKEGYPEIFNKRIGEARLSNGQKILLQFCMALFAQEVNLDNAVIFMDEPENHLHPAALIEVLDKITPHVRNGQVWIATHSINVLAHFNPSSIWYIENGQISYAGNTPRMVLEGLLGNEEEIQRLSTFLSLPAVMASDKFAFESLFYPEVLITRPDDPQVAQIYEIIKDRVTRRDKLKVLDFGIGKGRLLSTIHENERLRGYNSADWLDFNGYDKSDSHKHICMKVFEGIYGTSERRYFNNLTDILSRHERSTFDLIVMCNVFHEIDPKEWLTLFNSVTSPFQLLKDDGSLLIVEDQFLAVGEKAHSKGFLVFDELEMKRLFKITASDKYVSTDYRKDGRLKSHHIPRSCINRIDASSRKHSIETLHQRSKNEIKKLREETAPTYKTGKLHGFWAQQLANASLALEEL